MDQPLAANQSAKREGRGMGRRMLPTPTKWQVRRFRRQACRKPKLVSCHVGIGLFGGLSQYV
jgi:hypothetical protein